MHNRSHIKRKITEALSLRHQFLRNNYPWFKEHWNERDFQRDIPYRIKEVMHILSVCSIHSQASCLEVGIGGGQLLYSLRHMGYKVSGLDDNCGGSLGNDEIQNYFPGIDVFSLPLEKPQWPFESNSFDIVISNHVIEHIPTSPKLFLQEMFRVLKPGGWIYISNPNPGRLLFRVRALFRGKGFYPVGIPDYFDEFGKSTFQGHIREFTASELAFMVEQVGFKYIRSGTINLVYLLHGPVFRGKVVAILTNVFPSLRDCAYAIGRK